jgi:hypothetical protein
VPNLSQIKVLNLKKHYPKSKIPMLATLTIHLHLPLCASLKEKRGQD